MYKSQSSSIHYTYKIFLFYSGNYSWRCRYCFSRWIREHEPGSFCCS